MLCTTAINTSNRIRTQTDTAERKSTCLDTNSCYYVPGMHVVSVSVSRQSRELTTSHLGLGLFHVVGRDVLCGVRAVWRSIVVVVPCFLLLYKKCLLKQSQVSLLSVILWLFTSNPEIAILSFFLAK